MLGWVGVSGAVPLTARVDFAEVYSKCALAFTTVQAAGRRPPEAHDDSGLQRYPRPARRALECGVKFNRRWEKIDGDD